MDSPKHPAGQTERELFLQALDQTTPLERAAFLDAACGHDTSLRRRMELLLERFDQVDTFLEKPVVSISPANRAATSAPEIRPTIVVQVQPTEGLGTVIGRYKLLQEIGEGGMGVVYMAEQEEPVRRRVALKIIKLGMDTKSVIARFEAERQALAMMDHPNIAKVLDGGATDAGRPYFVMELVRGIKITEYCDEAKLSTRDRLDLFIKVCQAIQHAHQKGIIHRDIKPSNILVTINDGVAVPKVIDFGIAKATEGRLTDKTLFTQFEAFIGTPAYVSPEQAVMTSLDIDTRSDIYSLGVLLYELLAGSTPFDAKELMASGIDAMRKTIREQEPMRPSNRLATLQGDDLTTTAKRRSADTSKLLHQLKGDLDWIVMKCLEKDRSRRYETANGLASDLQRHLNNEAVLARPPSTAYRFQKLVRRNKLAFAAASAVALALIAGLSFSTWSFLRERRAHAGEVAQRQTAVEEQRKAVASQASEAVQRKLAETQRNVAEAQRNALIEQRKLADMQLALQAWEEGDLQRANDLIDASRPAPGQPPGFEWRYLRKLCRDQSFLTFGDTNQQYRSAQFFERDLLLLNDEKTLTLHNLFGGRDQLLLEDQDGIWGPTFCSGNTNLLATVTDGSRIKVWDLAARRVILAFEGHSGTQISSITFSRDGRWLASASGGDFSASSDNSVKVWDVESRNPKPIRTVHRYSYGARDVAFSPDGRQLFSSGTESMIRAWDVVTGSESAAPLEGHTAWGGPLATSADGLCMASGNGDSTVIIWNLISRKLERRLAGHSAPVDSVAISPDGRIVASGGWDHTIRLWDLKTGQQLPLLRGHGDKVNSIRFSPDGQWLVSRSVDGLVKLWPATTSLEGNPLSGKPVWLQAVALSPDGRHVASVASGSSAVHLWNLATRNLTLLNGHGNETVMKAAFSPDGRILATGSHDQTVRLWDVNDHKSVGTLTNGFPVGSLAFSPDGRTLIVGGSSYYFLEGNRAGLQFWDVPSQRATGTIPGDASDIIELALSASGSLLATGHRDGAVSLWDAQTRRLLHRFGSQFEKQVMSLSFSPTEPLLAASDVDGNIVLYNTTRMEILSPPLKAHTWRVLSLAFSPDGRTLASAGEGGGLKLWNVATRQVALTLKGHAGSVCGVAFSRDGNLLASCGADATVRLWSAAALDETDATPKTKPKKQ